jgi:hypothetical protein
MKTKDVLAGVILNVLDSLSNEIVEDVLSTSPEELIGKPVGSPLSAPNVNGHQFTPS